MALVELQNRGILKGVVSQNIDGLHRKSGIKTEIMAELHGNTNLERCIKCEREHMRDYKTSAGNKTHLTGRICDTPGCGGELKDTIINFGESLNGEILMRGFALHGMSDLAIAMGSSMRVQPACMMPLGCIANGGRFVMINLQKTQVDAAAHLVIHERVDKVIRLLMQKLEIPIPEWRRSYRMKVFLSQDKKQVKFTGVDANGACYTLFKNIKVSGVSPAAAQFPQRGQVQPYAHNITKQNVNEFSVQCTFQGHYAEPVVTFKVPMEKLRAAGAMEFEMVYHVASGAFEKVVMHNSETRDVLGEATFSAAAAPAAQQNRGGSPPAPQARGAAAARPAAAARQPAASAANRGKSVVASSAKRVGNNGRGPAAAASKVNGAANIPKSRPAMAASAFTNAAANVAALGAEHAAAAM